MSSQADQIREAILCEALKDVPFEGWDWEGIEKAADRLGYNPDMARAVFPARMKDVLQSFSDWADSQMLERLGAVDIETMRVQDRVRLAVKTRLEVLTPYKEALRLSVSYWLRPFRKWQASGKVWQTADVIWKWAGDKSKDYNYYTKRGLLSGIIVSTTLAWLSDDSPDMHITLGFLDRRIANVMKFGSFIGKLKKRA